MEETNISSPVAQIIAAMDDPTSIYDAPYELMGRESGKDVTEIQHLIRSLIDLFTTAIGTYPSLREYGCRLTDYIDHPMNESLKLDMIQAVFEAVDRWEPRLYLHEVDLTHGDEQGTLILSLKGYYLLEGRGVVLNNVTLDFKKEQRLTYETAN